MEGKTKVRDYDNDPIIIKDYNPILMYEILNKLFLLVLLVIIINPFNVPLSNMIGGLIGLLIIYYPIYREQKRRKKRFILLKESTIHIYDENEEELDKLVIKDINSIKKTYQMFYNKQQAISSFDGLKQTLGYLLYIILLPLKILDFIKILYKKVFLLIKFKSTANLNICDSIVLRSDNDFINILIPNTFIHNELRGYIFTKFSSDIEQLKTDLMFFYIHD